MLAKRPISTMNSKKRSIEQMQSLALPEENDTTFKRSCQGDSQADENEHEGMIHSGMAPSAVEDDAIPAFTGSSGVTNLWERKCSILEEELSLRVREKDCLKLQLEHERQLRKIQEVEVQQKLAKIQQLSTEIDGNKAAKTVALEEQLNVERRMRENHVDIIQKQRLEIQKLMAASTATNDNIKTEKFVALEKQLEEEKVMRRHHEHVIRNQRMEIQKLNTASAVANDDAKGKGKAGQGTPASNTGECASTDASLREQLIKSRRKQLQLVKILEGWKQKAMQLKSQLDMADQSRSNERRSKIAERRRIQMAEQLLQIGKNISSQDDQHQPVSPSPEQTNKEDTKIGNEMQQQQRDTAKNNVQRNAMINDDKCQVSSSNEYLRCHAIATAPKNALKFDGNRWIESAKDKYPSRRCRHPGCIKRVRTFCKCSPGYWRCHDHVDAHIAEVINGTC